MASKQYKSIIRLLDHCGIATGDDFNLSRAKKQLQAEFRMAADGMIEIGGCTYTQQEVFEEIDHPDFLPRLVFHQQIWNTPLLLALLEKNTIDLSGMAEAFKGFWSNKDFDLFFSPYFSGPFYYTSRTLLASCKLKDMGTLLGYEDFLQPAEREEAFRPIRIFLEENIRLLRNVNKENYRIIRPKMIHWIEEDWFLFFNCLPNEFYEQKIEIVTKLINIGVDVQKSQRQDCKKMSTQLVSLTEMPESIRKTIVSNHDVYTASREPGCSGTWWIFVVIFILIRIIGSNGCLGGSNKRNYYNDFQFQKLRDSLLKHSPAFKKTVDSLDALTADSLDAITVDSLVQ